MHSYVWYPTRQPNESRCWSVTNRAGRFAATSMAAMAADPAVTAGVSCRPPSWLLRSSATDAACLRRPSVVVVEPAQHREGHDAPAGLYAARPLPLVRDPLPDPLVRSPPVEVSHPFGEHAA